MASNTLETPKTTVKFDSLALLREELGKQASNADRLGEFQKTIDEALEKGDREGVIEFTEDEWKSLITNEDLPPIEQVKNLLKNKIEGMKGVKTESKEKREGIVGELQTKAEEVKKSLGEKADGLKGAATGKIQEWKERAEKLKQYSKPGLWFLGIGLSLKLWGYKLGNWLSGLLGKKGEYDADIKKIEMEQEFIKDPKAALEKYGAEAKEKLEGKKEEAGNKGKEIMEKIPGIAGLSVLAVSTFALLKNILPPSLTKNVNPEDGTSILKMARKWKILKYLGAGGLALWGASALYAHTTENPNAVTSLGAMPEDKEGKKNWLQKIGASAGIATESLSSLSTYFTEGVDSIKNGFEVSDGRPPAEPGNAYLDEHPLIKQPIDAVKKMAANLLKAYKKNPELYISALSILALTFPGVRGLVIRAGMGVGELAIELSKCMASTAVKHPYMMGAGALVGITGLGYAAHLQLKDNATYEEMLEFTGSMMNVDEIKEKIGEFIPDSVADKATYLADVISHKTGEIVDFCEHAFDRCTDAVKEAIKLDDIEQVCSMSKTGLGAFQSEFSVESTDSLSRLPGIDMLCGKDKKSGVIGECLKKVESGTKMDEGDIHKLMQATKGTNIRIFPEGGDKATGRYIQFVVLDDNGRVTTLPKNICPNPSLSETTQAGLYVDFLYDPSSTNGLEKGVTQTGKGLRKLASDITEGANKEGALNKFFSIGGSIVSFGTKAFLTLGKDIVQIPFDTALNSGSLNLQTQEGWCEFGGDMMPIVVVGTGIKMVPFLGTSLKFVTVKPLAAGANFTLKHLGESMNFSLIEKSFGQTKLELLNKKLLSSHSYLEKKILEMRIKRLEGKEANTQKKFYGKLTVEDLELKKKEILSQQEKELDKIAEKHGNSPEADRKFADLSARNNAAIEELEKIAKNLEAKNLGQELPHPKINLKAIEGVKIRGRGLVAIASALGLMYLGSKVVDAIKGPDSGTYRTKTAEQILEEASEDGYDDEEIDYFGYDENIETTQKIDANGELIPVSLNVKEAEDGDNEFICENSREFEIKMAQVSMEYQSDMDTFLGKVQDKSASIEDINRAGEAHEKHVEYTKKLIGNNKEMLKDFWKDKMKENGIIDEVIPEQLKQQGFKAFMAIFHREGKFQLEYMNKQDLKNVLTKIMDASEKSGWVEGGKIAFSLVPFAGNIVAASDAVDDFKNGNIGSGMWNVGWCVGGLALDIFSFGTAGTAARAVKAGTKIGTKIAVNAVGHGGIMIGGQMIQQYFDDARSESINIDTLPEAHKSTGSHNTSAQDSSWI